MRFSSSLKTVGTLALLLAGSIWNTSYGQSGCARCAQPPLQTFWNLQPANRTDVATRFKPDRPRFEETPPVPSPYYTPEQPKTDDFVSSSSTRSRGSKPVLIPTDSTISNSRATSPTEKPRTPSTTPANKRTVAEKIALRYSDPRVQRLMKQLSSSSVEQMYIEVSELIDGRHITPATYARRVDGALDHLIQALEVPAFLDAAEVRGDANAIASLQSDLQELRTRAKIRSTNDAIAMMRNVQLKTVQEIDINPAAIGLEFVYGATDSLDQFSMLLPPEKDGGPSVGLRDNVVGIGVEVEPHPAGLKILKLLPGGPAAQADLRKGDVITQVDGNDLKQMELNRAVEFIVGPEGSQIQIQAIRGDRSGRVTLVRQKIAMHSVVDVKMLNETKGVGYLKLEQFAESTTNELDAALLKLHQQGMQSLVMDLRGNPGGLLTTSIAVSDRFLPGGTIVSTRGRTEADNSKEVAQFAKTWKMPLVVLIDHNSASASEIFAAAIQENHRGLIVGEKSYGKGTVQTLFPLQSSPAGLRLTTAKFYSPQGREMAGVGVTPDIAVTNDSTDSQSDDAVLNEGVRQISDPRVKEMANNFRRTGDATDDDSHVAA
ncbi:S41 family peptidase [Schlesneria paludicola]|uniref:S41 family peptidase n=1 Tax=Schlesneria paludicola TaxID=360056 RepID=UPI00029B29C0|nr:S41 family peptidase [Schlesneria paludicola]